MLNIHAGTATLGSSATPMKYLEFAQDVLVAKQAELLIPSFKVCPPYSGSRTVSPTTTFTDTFVPVSVTRPGPTATTSPSFVFPSLLSGR